MLIEFAVSNHSPSLTRILPSDSTTTTANILKVVTVMPGTHSQPPPLPNLSTHPSTTGPIITEMPSENFDNDGNDSVILESDRMHSNNTVNSIILNKSTCLTRQRSVGAKSVDSPSLPKRNQPNTSSAPSTLSKKGLEQDEKKEIYV